jgi:chloride channel protein, CIC family
MKNKTLKPLNTFSLFLMAVMIGVVAGLGAVVFRGLIAFFHNLFFLGEFSLTYTSTIHTPNSPWGPFIILVPVLGAVCVAFLVQTFAPEAKGHGVPEVMDAVYYNKGIIRPIVALIKSLASALSIGSGGSIGREGPIIQIGASFGSTVGQILSVPTWQRITLIAAGAGGGIAATFNTPVGGVLFALEIILHEVSARTLVPVTISTVMATYIGRIFFGDHPSFLIPEFEVPFFHLTQPLTLFAYVGLGLIMGVVSTLFIKSLYGLEDFFDQHVPGNYYTRHMLGMLLVGIIMYLLFVNTGHYHVEGVGYATVQDILTSTLQNPYLLIVLFLLKLLVTNLTLGSGASGGIFSPSLFMGATLGGAYGVILHLTFPSMTISPAAFAVAGMAGLVGGVTGAALAAIVMIFEMTLNYNVIIPMTITVAISYGMRVFLSRESIYTQKLVRRGHYMPKAMRKNFQDLKQAKEMMHTRVIIIPSSDTLADFAQVASKHVNVQYFVVAKGNKILGVISKTEALRALRELEKQIHVGDVVSKDYITINEDLTFLDILHLMYTRDVSLALVLDHLNGDSPENIKGLISREDLANYMSDTVELFTDV